MDVQQGLMCKNCVTHDTFIDQPVRKKKHYYCKRDIYFHASCIISASSLWALVCTQYMACPSVSVGCWAVMWFCMLGADLKAMGQLGHLWNISQWACWMWDFTEFSPPNTTRQLEHLQSEKDVMLCENVNWVSVDRTAHLTEQPHRAITHLYPMRRAKCKQVSSRCVWKCACLAVPPHSGQMCGWQLWWMRWWAAALQLLGRSIGGEHSVHDWRTTEEE